ncbi:methyltransferase [Corallincola platygyrae]|uniref:Ribosomal RNA large subunit methyltransferase G n=1 Tax=Corallincola platygyrae TaxID=1193278 RepID=A0ABW4XMI5_9GAMM
MNRNVTLAGHALTLDRFPLSKDPNLQAWDAADEYLIKQIEELGLLDSEQTIHIYNDGFGALTCALAARATSSNLAFKLVNISDSFLAQQACKTNLQQNSPTDADVTFLSSMDAIERDADLVLMKVPKNHGLLTHQLAQISQYRSMPTVLASAKANLLPRSVVEQFNRLGSSQPSLAWKKCRVIHCQPEQANRLSLPEPLRWKLENSSFTMVNHANVFARQQLDIGARFLLEQLPKNEAFKQVIDLGCGNGVLTLCLLANNDVEEMIAIDESYMAVSSADSSVMENLPEKHKHCQFVTNNCLDGFKANTADLIVCNPPFHQNNAVMDDIAWQMFKDAKRVLTPGGKLRIVGNRHLGYHIKLKRLFGHCKTVAGNKKFVILEASKN